MQVLENRKKGYTMTSSRCGIASVFMNSQQLWFLASSLHKTGPVKCHPRIGKKALGALPLTAELLANEKLWKRQLLFLGVHTMS